MKLLVTPDIRGRVWATGGYKNRWTWHFEVRVAGRRVLYDTTGSFGPIYCAAVMRVETLRHLARAHPDLGIPEYKT